MITCGLDFGTSNSAIGVLRDDVATLAPLEDDRTLMPSAVFFDYETKNQVLFGSDAIAAYVGQTEGRLMRALKSILGSPLIDEETSLGSRKVRLTEVVEFLVRHLKHKAEEFAGQEVTSVVHGRPVRFVDGDDSADARAQAVLEAIARRAGFRDIRFVYEPIAAAHHYEQTVQTEELVLIADIGGGTSDFSIVRIGPERRDRSDRDDDVLANAGVRVGGTDFDTALNLAAVMPLLGFGTQLVAKNLPMPERARLHRLLSPLRKIRLMKNPPPNLLVRKHVSTFPAKMTLRPPSVSIISSWLANTRRKPANVMLFALRFSRARFPI